MSAASGAVNVLQATNDLSKSGGEFFADLLSFAANKQPIELRGVYDPLLKTKLGQTIIDANQWLGLGLGLASLSSIPNSFKAVRFFGPSGTLSRAPVEAIDILDKAKLSLDLLLLVRSSNVASVTKK
jgi:hypothetical protein